jgi:hypothetical protein
LQLIDRPAGITVEEAAQELDVARAELPGEAKLTVGEAAKMAKTPWEWNAVAAAYQRLGYEGNASVARRRAIEALR